ncbi:MAG: 1-acyl-sn-glycerol-3-phosphate acyltransferase [Clostridiales bacterium]|nr:1-acyl-sn-glycerol-3-phosphate acyltransferase [Candidatus Scatonaster coprocaballi]
MHTKEKDELDRTPKSRVERSSDGQPDYGRKPSFFWYKIFGTGLLINATRLFFHVKIKTDKRIKNLDGPLVLVGNHPSFIDPIIMGTTVYGRPINFVAGAFLFRNKIISHVLTKGGCIPKAQYRNDLRTVRAMFKVMNRGGVLGIFPEATRLVDGHSIPFDSGLATLVKRSGANIAFLQTHGAYMTWPRWTESGWRRGRITAEYVRVMTKEEIANMSVQELQDEMQRTMVYDEYAYFREHPQVFRSKKPAAGAQNVACICPKCEGMNTIHSDGHDLTCESCGNHVKMTPYGFFEAATEKDRCFEDLHQWNEWEQGIFEREVSRPGYMLEEPVVVHHALGEYDHAKTGSGKITIRDGYLTFEGKLCKPEEGIIYKKGKPIRAHRNRDIAAVAQPVTKSYNTRKLKGVVYDLGEKLELYDSDGQVIYLYPEHPQRIHEICSVLSAMRKLEIGNADTTTPD